jgi:hypothetical protein
MAYVEALRPVKARRVTPAQFGLLTPQHNDEVLLIVDEANGVEWHLRYVAFLADGSPNTSAYKWEVEGGTPLQARVNSSGSMATGGTPAGNWQDPTTGTAGPQVGPLPLSGLYDFRYGAQIDDNTSTGGTKGFAPKIGSAAVDDDDGAYNMTWKAVSVTGFTRKAATAGDTVVCKVKTTVASATITWQRRWLTVMPQRLGT